MVRSQVEVGSYITHVNDHFVVGNTFASVLQLLRQEKRPLKIRFERGVATEDPYCYRGDKPVLEVSEEKAVVELFSNNIAWLQNNMMVDKQMGTLMTIRVLLLEESSSVVENIRFLLRRRSQVPVNVNKVWEIQDSEISRYPRQMILEIIRKDMKTLLEQNLLALLFEVLNNVATRRRREV